MHGRTRRQTRQAAANASNEGDAERAFGQYTPLSTLGLPATREGPRTRMATRVTRSSAAAEQATRTAAESGQNSFRRMMSLLISANKMTKEEAEQLVEGARSLEVTISRLS